MGPEKGAREEGKLVPGYNQRWLEVNRKSLPDSDLRPREKTLKRGKKTAAFVLSKGGRKRAEEIGSPSRVTARMGGQEGLGKGNIVPVW